MFPSFSSKDIAALSEAYASVYEGYQRNPEKGEEEDDKKYGHVRGESRPMPPRGNKDREAFEKWYASQMNGKKKKEVEENYEIILSHLLSEGYADTAEGAVAIMANMSEEWRQSIVEEVLVEISLKTKMSAYARSQDPDADYEYGSKVHSQGERIKKSIVKKHGEKAGEHAERHADAQHWGRKDASGKRKGLPKPRIQKNRTYRTTKTGKMHGQDQAKLKRDLKYNRFVED